MVFALGISNPVSIILVDKRTSYWPSTKSTITRSSAWPSIWPWPTAMRTLPNIRSSICLISSMSFMRLWTKKTCPPRYNSNCIASAITSVLNVWTSVCTGWRFSGGVRITDKSLAPMRLNCRVRGIGVAVKVNVSTLSLMVLSFSLTPTPNFCSSSTIRSPRSFHCTALPTKEWVPMQISIFPWASFS